MIHRVLKKNIHSIIINTNKCSIGGSQMDRIKNCISVYIVDNSRHILRGKLLNVKDDTYYLQLENGSELWTCRNNVFFTLEDAFFSKAEVI